MSADVPLAERAALYALARETCSGARVLDLDPCPDAAGRLLAWGARSVLSVNPMPPDPAQTPAGPDPRASVAVADAASDRLDGLGGFDLVLALGIAPGSPRAAGLLATAAARRAPGGVVIACLRPVPGGARTLAGSVREIARDSLGAPTQILVGLPARGTLFVDSEARRLDRAAGLAAQEDLFCAARVAGADGRIELASAIALVWGRTLPDAAALAYAEPPPVRRGLLDRLGLRRLRRGARPAG